MHSFRLYLYPADYIFCSTLHFLSYPGDLTQKVLFIKGKAKYPSLSRSSLPLLLSPGCPPIHFLYCLTTSDPHVLEQVKCSGTFPLYSSHSTNFYALTLCGSASETTSSWVILCNYRTPPLEPLNVLFLAAVTP